jgi:hypothetical protein
MFSTETSCVLVIINEDNISEVIPAKNAKNAAINKSCVLI